MYRVTPADDPPRRGFEPREITAVEDTGLGYQFLADLTLKTIYFVSTITGFEVAQRLRLPFVGVVERLLDGLKRDTYIEVRGGSSVTTATYSYVITSKGIARALDLIERSSYVGPAPVTLAEYWEAVKAQSIKDVSVNQQGMRQAYRDLVIGERLMNQLGPAINSAQSMFLFGPPGNGKTTLAETAARLLGGSVYIDWAELIAG